MRYLPIHLDLKDAPVLVLGGGSMAEAKLRTLVKTGANILVLSDTIVAEIARWQEQGLLRFEPRAHTDADIAGRRLVYAACGDKTKDAAIAKQCRALGVLVNAVDYKEASDFFSPALVNRSPVTISIGTEGHSPGLARAIKADLEARLPAKLGELARHIGTVRTRLSTVLPDFKSRQKFWGRIFNGKDLRAQLKWDAHKLDEQVEALLAQGDLEASDPIKGHVSLVGAGPGNPELLTHQARHKLFSADVIIYDRLVSKGVLEFGRTDAEFIYVGKDPHGASTPQDDINTLLITHANRGHNVVRLKGGDPLVFGRADEEVDALIAAEISYEICPGITAAAAAAAAMGVGLTARGTNTSVRFMTGHDSKGYAEQNWKALSENNGRAAIYMGLGAAAFIRDKLIEHGSAQNADIAVVENASRADQKIIASTLGTLVSDLDTHNIKGPAILLLGYRPRRNFTTKDIT